MQAAMTRLNYVEGKQSDEWSSLSSPAEESFPAVVPNRPLQRRAMGDLQMAG